MADAPAAPAAPAVPVPPAPARSLGERIVRATAAISVAYLLARLMGLVQSRVVGDVIGLKAMADAFWFAFDSVLGALFLIGEESLAPAYIPVFKAALDEQGEESAWRFVSTLLNLQILILCVPVALLMTCPQHVVGWLSSFGEFGTDDSQRIGLAAYFLQFMAPALFGLSLASMTYTVLVGYKRFFWPAIAEAALKAALVSVVYVGYRLGLDKRALVAGVLAAGVVKISVHAWGLRDKLRFWRPVLDLRDPRLRKFLILVAPLLAGVLFAKVRDWFNYTYLLSAQEGLLSVNKYARQTFNTLSGIVPYPLSIAMLPFFCDLVAKNDRTEMGGFMTRASRMLLLCFMPLAAVLAVLAVPLAQALYQTGKVSAEEAALVGEVSACYTAVLPFNALELVFMQAYFSTRRTLSVTLIGIFTSSLAMIAGFVAVRIYHLEGLRAVMAVALSFTLSKALKSVVLAGLLKAEKLPLLPFRSTVGFLLRALVLTAACAGCAYGTLRQVERLWPPPPRVAAPANENVPAPPAGPSANEAAGAPSAAPAAKPSGIKALLGALPRIIVPGAAALAVFIAGAKLLRMKELDEMYAFAREKLRRKRQGQPSSPAPPPVE